MQLIGMFDSPYVRRVAIALRVLGLPFEHRNLSVFGDYEEIARINPAVKVPTFVDDDGTVLIDSALILDHLDRKVPADRRLLPEAPHDRIFALRVTGFALAVMEKTVQQVYEHKLRPADRQYESWSKRLAGQMHGAYGTLDALASGHPGWLCAGRITQADISVAVAWRFTQHAFPDAVDAARYPALAALSARAEALPEFAATPLE